ncbi:MAG: CoA-binding protein [Cyanobacteria bacterium P01_H01_bin.74]
MKDFVTEFAKQPCWAIVGVSENPDKFGYKIYKDLKSSGYKVFGVNPKLSQLLGDVVYPSVIKLPCLPDVVNVVVPPASASRVIDDCVTAGVTRIWFQPGSSDAAIVKKANKAGLKVVCEACIMIEKNR